MGKAEDISAARSLPHQFTTLASDSASDHEEHCEPVWAEPAALQSAARGGPLHPAHREPAAEPGWEAQSKNKKGMPATPPPAAGSPSG